MNESFKYESVVQLLMSRPHVNPLCLLTQTFSCCSSHCQPPRFQLTDAAPPPMTIALPNVSLRGNGGNKVGSGPASFTDTTLSLCSLQWQIPLTVAVGNESSVCVEHLIWINNRTGTSVSSSAVTLYSPIRP